MEIQFFGVSGSVIESEENVLDSISINDPSQNLGLDLKSGFDIDVEIRNSQETVKFTIADAQID